MISPFHEMTNLLLEKRSSLGSFTLYLYKFTPENEKIADLDPSYQDYEVCFKSERGVVSIFSKNEDLYNKAKDYLTYLYGHGPHELDTGNTVEHLAVIWE
jgi:hypothetical protein